MNVYKILGFDVPRSKFAKMDLIKPMKIVNDFFFCTPTVEIRSLHDTSWLGQPEQPHRARDDNNYRQQLPLAWSDIDATWRIMFSP
jgi:hypothetical protein